ncbi:hypothetical protein VHUM_02229 [Vanrija humicola]|uniref:NmrA-like domain-containing protein n=1 Tax=Vanrija humicola TaxID=5417 RepID=A0A7D8ZPS6_VANHU|nr:hypothetical protein VHUM_02229 [Vanrija humicola]
MPSTVALIGGTGLLGSHILTALARAQEAGKYKVVAFHRQSSDTSKWPKGVEKRVLDNDKASATEVAEALKGVDILLAAGKNTAEGGKLFLDNLAKLPKGQLKVFIPSWFTANWTQDELDDEKFLYRYQKYQLLKYAESLDLPITTFAATLFEDYVYPAWDFLSIDVAGNRVAFYGDARNQRFTSISLDYLGESVAQLFSRPDFGPGQKYTLQETVFTGQELVDVLTAAHGKAPTVTAYTDADVEEAQKNPGAGLGAAWRVHWGKGRWNTVNLFQPKGVTPRTLDQAVRFWINKGKL